MTAESMSMKRVAWIIVALTLLGVFGYTLVFLWSKSQTPPTVYETEEPVHTDIVKKTVATGAIIPRQEVEIKPRVSGVIEELAVEPGAAIKRGDLIARIEIVPDVVTVNRAESELAAAKISFGNAQRELERHQRLFEKKVLSETELAQRRLEFELRQQELAAAASNLQLIKEGASRNSGKVSNEVRSTVDGMVLEVPVRVGESVIESNTFNAGTTIAFVANMGDMIFEGNVDESEVGKIKEGMALDIQIGAIEGQTFAGTLEYISPKGVEEEGAIQFEIRAAIAPHEGTFIRAGYSANADIVLDRREGVLAVRESLLQFEDGKPYVEVQTSNQRFEKRFLDVGLSDGIHIEVKNGIETDARLKQITGAPGSGPPHQRG